MKNKINIALALLTYEDNRSDISLREDLCTFQIHIRRFTQKQRKVVNRSDKEAGLCNRHLQDT